MTAPFLLLAFLTLAASLVVGANLSRLGLTLTVVVFLGGHP